MVKKLRCSPGGDGNRANLTPIHSCTTHSGDEKTAKKYTTLHNRMV
jgi:hypothetical protein